MLALLILLGTGWWFMDGTDSYYRLVNRFSDNDLFAERILESSGFFSDLEYDVLIGRGLGGYYRNPWNGDDGWRANHIGFLGFVLRGGVTMLAVFLAFFMSFNFLKNRKWFDNEQNFAAFLMAPWIMGTITLNPIGFSPDSLFAAMVYGFVLARLNVVAPRNHAPQYPHPQFLQR